MPEATLHLPACSLNRHAPASLGNIPAISRQNYRTITPLLEFGEEGAELLRVVEQGLVLVEFDG
jgi:hypothetical protein